MLASLIRGGENYFSPNYFTVKSAAAGCVQTGLLRKTAITDRYSMSRRHHVRTPSQPSTLIG